MLLSRGTTNVHGTPASELWALARGGAAALLVWNPDTRAAGMVRIVLGRSSMVDDDAVQTTICEKCRVILELDWFGGDVINRSCKSSCEQLLTDIISFELFATSDTCSAPQAAAPTAGRATQQHQPRHRFCCIHPTATACYRKKRPQIVFIALETPLNTQQTNLQE